MFSLRQYMKNAGADNNDESIESVPEFCDISELPELRGETEIEKLNSLLDCGTSLQKEWSVRKILQLPSDELFDETNSFSTIHHVLRKMNENDPKIEIAIIEEIINMNDIHLEKLSHFILEPLLIKFETHFPSEYLYVFKKMYKFFSRQQFDQIFLKIDENLKQLSNYKLSAIALLSTIPKENFKDGQIQQYFKIVSSLGNNSSIIQPYSVYFAFTFADCLNDDELFEFFRLVLTDTLISEDCSLLFLQFSQITLGPRFPLLKIYFLPLISRLANSTQIKVRLDFPKILSESPLVIQTCPIPLKNALLFLARDKIPSVRSSLVESLPNIYKYADNSLKNHLIYIYSFILDDVAYEVQMKTLSSPLIKMFLEHNITNITVLFQCINKQIKRWRVVSQFINSLTNISFKTLEPYFSDCVKIMNESIIENPNALLNTAVHFYSSFIASSFDCNLANQSDKYNVSKNSNLLNDLVNQLIDFYKNSKIFWLRRNFIVISSNILSITPPDIGVKSLVPSIFEIAKENIKSIQYSFMNLATSKICKFLNNVLSNKNLNNDIVQKSTELMNDLKSIITTFEKSEDPYLLELYNVNINLLNETEPLKEVPASPKSSSSGINNVLLLNSRSPLNQPESKITLKPVKSVELLTTLSKISPCRITPKNPINTRSMITVPRVSRLKDILSSNSSLI